MADFDTTVAALSPLPEAFWNLNDSSGATTIVDVEGNHTVTAGNYSGILQGATGILVNDTKKSATFAGPCKMHADPSGSAAWNTGTGGDITIFFAFKIASPPASTQVFFAWPDGGGWAGINSSGKIVNNFCNGSGAVGTNNVCNNALHFLVVKRSSGSITFKIDNTVDAALSTSGDTTNITGTTSGFIFGALDPGADFPLTGSVEKIGILKRATTGTEDTNLYNATQTGSTSSITIPVTDSNWFHSPLNTWSDGVGSMQANHVFGSSTVAAMIATGAYGHVKVGPTANISLLVDVSRTSGAGANSANYPILSISLDNGTWTDFQLASAQTSVAILSGGTSATHDVRYRLKAIGGLVEKWTPSGSPAIPPAWPVITGLQVDTGCATTSITTRPKIAVWEGDSTEEGNLALINSGSGSALNSDATSCHWIRLICEKVLNAEYCQRGYGGTGYASAAGSSGVPAYNSNAQYFFGTVSKLDGSSHYLIQPDYYIIQHGINGTTLQSDVATAITNARSRAPNAYILIALPPTSTNANTAILAAVAAAGDAKVILISTDQSVGGDTSLTEDGTHPIMPFGQAQIAMDMAPKIRAAIGNAGTGPNSTTLTIHDSGGSPLSGVEVFVTRDSAGAIVDAGPLVTDGSGQVAFNLTTGNTYYAWAFKDNSHGSAVGTSFTA